VIAEYPGHELNMITVEYPPGGGSKPHGHNAYVLVFILEGALEMKLRGTPLVTVRAGESFVEHPEDVHEISRNASQTERAKFLVVALKATGLPLSISVPSK
jgi:quercetin dioxygenase-like cupin family protein